MSRTLLTLAALLVTATIASAQDPKPRSPGPTDKGFLLPNGWTISPAGKQVTLTDLPLNILTTPDGKLALVATSGFNAHELSLIDLATGQIVSKVSRKQSWYGLVADAKRETIWWSGGGSNILTLISRDDSSLKITSDPEPTDAASKARANGHFRAGLCLGPEGRFMYSLDIDDGSISALGLVPDQATVTASAGKRPYDVVLSHDGKRLFVSDWAGRSVCVLDPETLATRSTIAVGEHPNQMAVHPTDGRVFVACASSNTVSVIDGKADIVIETIATSLFPRAPEGSTPDALVVSPDGETLYVANADNNCIAVVDVEKPGRSQVRGFIPTGWYPTAVALTPDGETLLIGVGKGNQTKANPIPKGEPLKTEKSKGRPYPYIGTTLSGALSIAPVPDDKQLAAYTETVYRNCPYSDAQLSAAPHARKTAIPTRVGDPSPIKHVLYVIKENRTYDQVLGDMKKGNGDPSLCMFPEKVTPNHHKLAEEFVLLDNLYCNGHVSADGHPWSTMAYNTDYIARNWSLTYSGRAGVDDDDEGDLAKAPSGYIWDACKAAGLSYRSYGEYGRRVSQPDGTFKMEGAVPGLVGHVCPDWGAPKPDKTPVRDTERVETFLKEFYQFEKDGKLPRFMVMSLGEDHTTGTSPGTFTPEACVASNDLALGRLVDAVSHSKSWAETAIFVIEDDAQNGPDHVDAHRTVGFVISPYTRRHHLDSTQYGTVSLLRTMELILGLKPLSQFDAAANPMFECFEDKADLSPYSHEKARIDLGVKNTKLSYGADRSSKMDFTEYDKIDDFELNEILWRAIKGKDAAIPSAVRRAIAFRSAAKP
ncbi:MAG: Phosphoesterase family protein [Planctomycetota bacterium]|nr:Phosphoesterase family protein [Planctomycetota bacterium]